MLWCAGARESHQMGTIVPFSFRQNDCHSDTQRKASWHWNMLRMYMHIPVHNLVAWFIWLFVLIWSTFNGLLSWLWRVFSLQHNRQFNFNQCFVASCWPINRFRKTIQNEYIRWLLKWEFFFFFLFGLNLFWII